MTATKTVHHATPCAIVNIWLAKDKEGYTTTSSEGGRLSQEKPRGWARCGHASMTMCAKYTPCVYASFWPGENVPGVLVDSFDIDVQQEDRTLPDVIVCLYKLNIDKMITAFATAEKRVLAGELSWQLQISGSDDVTSSSTTTANCTTFVYSLLKIGGLATAYKGHLSAKGPKDKSFYKVMKCAAGDRAGGIFNAAPWTSWKLTPKALLLRVASAAEGSSLDVQMTRQMMADTSRVAREKIPGAHQATEKPEEKKGVKKKQQAGGVPVDKHGRNALHNAAGSGQLEVAKQLLASTHKKYLESKEETGCTPLLLAAFFGHAKMCTFLISAGADPSAADNLGRNSLHYAAERGKTEVLKALLSCNTGYALLTSTDSEGFTPLDLALAQNQNKASELLIDYGALPDSTAEPAASYAGPASSASAGSAGSAGEPKSGDDEGGCLVC